MHTKKFIIFPCVIIYLLIVVMALTGCASDNTSDHPSTPTSETPTLIAADDESEDSAAADDSDDAYSEDDWEKKEKIFIKSSSVQNSVMYYVSNSGVWKLESGKECVQLSSRPGDEIAIDGSTIFYSHYDIEKQQGSIRSIQTDGSEDVEICQIAYKAGQLSAADGKLYYISADPDVTPQNPISSLFSCDITTAETSVLAKDVFQYAAPVNQRIFYMDSGGSEFNLSGNIHLLDLADGTEKTIDDNCYDKGFYPENDTVYMIRSSYDNDYRYTLCSYDLNSLEQKELCTLSEGDARKGVYPVGVYDHSFLYAIEDYDVVNGYYTYYRYDIETNKISEIEGLPGTRGSLISFKDNAVWSFDDGYYSYETSEQLAAVDNNDEQTIIYFDHKLYQLKDNGSLELYQNLLN